ncbi:MAG: tRNA 2-thiouridine(34) synthase MnmA [Candidatus Omnitrophica bacterium]|nr:tRNA 2-thiouridine(34) synthase MnmA [Candidatus Omnitrophota bacterium]MCB9747321.1 tRNA 2-thiouridine(34) synthase MnmA [Candidatus Omnitrophota bacterium]
MINKYSNNKSEEMNNKTKKVFVAMSGGVDSSVVAALMKEQGHDVVGVTMCFSITHPDSKKPSCCGVDGIQDAKRAAQILNIPHYVLDFAKDINEYIIDNFTDEYLNGRTPNPCVRCNQHLKFGTLYQKVMSLGADYLATGHYAKIHFNSDKNCYEMKKAQDERKDQSYFLYSMKKETLPRVLFPLGDLTKAEVRVLAEKYKLNTADKPESQDICFVPDSGYKKFIENRVGESASTPGNFVNEKGEVVGEHKGIINYTIGQRDKLGIALGHPVYVYKIDKDTNTVFVGPREFLYAQGLHARGFNPVSREFPINAPIEVQARIRYNSPEVDAQLIYLGNGEVTVRFKEPQKSVTPGQSVVFYQDDVVLSGAIIEKSI